MPQSQRDAGATAMLKTGESASIPLRFDKLCRQNRSPLVPRSVHDSDFIGKKCRTLNDLVRSTPSLTSPQLCVISFNPPYRSCYAVVAMRFGARIDATFSGERIEAVRSTYRLEVSLINAARKFVSHAMHRVGRWRSSATQQ
jgi:hypothetical protein